VDSLLGGDLLVALLALGFGTSRALVLGLLVLGNALVMLALVSLRARGLRLGNLILLFVDLVGGLAGTVVSQFTLLAADVGFSEDLGGAAFLVLSVSLGADQRAFLVFLGDALLAVLLGFVSLGA